MARVKEKGEGLENVFLSRIFGFSGEEGGKTRQYLTRINEWFTTHCAMTYSSCDTMLFGNGMNEINKCAANNTKYNLTYFAHLSVK